MTPDEMKKDLKDEKTVTDQNSVDSTFLKESELSEEAMNNIAGGINFPGKR